MLLMSREYLAMWDQEGLECLFDITDMDHNMMIAKLKGESFKVPFNLSTLILRARYNSQRHYEIYTFSTEDSITQDQVKELFDINPQYIVDFIRKEGRKLYSDRNEPNRIKIT